MAFTMLKVTGRVEAFSGRVLAGAVICEIGRAKRERRKGRREGGRGKRNGVTREEMKRR